MLLIQPNRARAAPPRRSFELPGELDAPPLFGRLGTLPFNVSKDYSTLGQTRNRARLLKINKRARARRTSST
jgi:hypothetical protein